MHSEGGRFEVEIHYACAPGQEGATVELSFNDASARGTVQPVHNPPIRGAEHDRATDFVRALGVPPRKPPGFRPASGLLDRQ